MTRYRQKTLRVIDSTFDDGPKTARQIADMLGMEFRTVRNYLNAHPKKWAPVRPHSPNWDRKERVLDGAPESGPESDSGSREG